MLLNNETRALGGGGSKSDTYSNNKYRTVFVENKIEDYQSIREKRSLLNALFIYLVVK